MYKERIQLVRQQFEQQGVHQHPLVERYRARFVSALFGSFFFWNFALP